MVAVNGGVTFIQQKTPRHCRAIGGVGVGGVMALSSSDSSCRDRVLLSKFAKRLVFLIPVRVHGMPVADIFAGTGIHAIQGGGVCPERVHCDCHDRLVFFILTISRYA